MLKECQWNMPANSKEWDSKPLEIMAEVFPKLETTKWYRDQAKIGTDREIDVVLGKDNQN